MQPVMEAVGSLLPTAAAVALSPFPVIAVVLMLGTPRARSNGPMFALGWLVGLTAVIAIVITVAGGASDPDSSTADTVEWGKVVLGVVFLVMALRQWRKRPRGDEETTMPAWMAAIDGFTPVRSLGLGVALSAVNPKNLVLTMAGAATIARAGLPADEEILAAAIFIVLASTTVVGCVAAYLVATEKVEGPLARLKDFMAKHNTAIMVTVLLLLGLKILGDGLGAIG
jgi:threonine/homoserine/homoserine lactone efflux protein